MTEHLPHLLSISLRTVIMYFAAFGVMRIMGKREIGELSIFDLVISIMIAEIAVFALEDLKRPLYEGLLPMVILLMIQILLAVLSLRFRKVRVWVDGRPSIIVRNGKIDRAEMKKQRYNLDDLLMQLRSNNIDSLSDVEFAVLETSGQLSVIPKDSTQSGGGSDSSSSDSINSSDSGNADTSKQNEESSISSKVRLEPLPLPLIMDGQVEEANLQQIGKTRFWLKNQIHSKGIDDFKDVFFCSIDHRGRLYINAMDDV